MTAQSCNLAVLFVGCSPRDLGREVRNAIMILSAHGQYVVPFGRTHLQAVRGGENFLKLLTDQHIAVKTHMKLVV
jgi:hypothetical protein